MSDYEARRAEKIQANQALWAELDIKQITTKHTRNGDEKPPPSKRRKVLQDTAPSRTSARIAAVPVKPSYNDEPSIKAVTLPRSLAKKSKTSNKDDLDPFQPVHPREAVLSAIKFCVAKTLGAWHRLLSL
ncbi:hypothetical protein LTR62_002699 [Meristemomyces frigidus]|uniref:Uncharacterized protein n=1 Tax=Meristemomyces frigidus TaxID=1508187 RepID=A0AAN7TFG6_9PEZI|nr:hypothetical protein LTR62_002699 [Meristemomyces frigidus]